MSYKYFSFVDEEDKKSVKRLIRETPKAIEHLESKCHTLILTLKGQSYFIVQQSADDYGMLRIIDPRMRAEILLEGGAMCGYGHIDLVTAFLLEEAEALLISGTPEKRIEAANMLAAIGKLMAEKAISETIKLLRLLDSQPQIGFPRVTDDTQN